VDTDALPASAVVAINWHNKAADAARLPSGYTASFERNFGGGGQAVSFAVKLDPATPNENPANTTWATNGMNASTLVAIDEQALGGSSPLSMLIAAGATM
jgi:hypothetical protein